MTYLALDIGTRRIGVAVGSTELKIASPLGVIERAKIEHDAYEIRALVEQYDVTRIVVGLPRELDGVIGGQAENVMQYISRLQTHLVLPFEFFDERYSTVDALARRRAAGVTDKRGRATIDALAAAVILQDFFDGQV